MFGFITHGLLFAFLGSWFWIAGIGGHTARAFYFASAIGFIAGSITYFFREKQIISPKSVDGESISIIWQILPCLDHNRPFAFGVMGADSRFMMPPPPGKLDALKARRWMAHRGWCSAVED